MIVGVHHRHAPDFLAGLPCDFPGEAFAHVADIEVQGEDDLLRLSAAFALSQHLSCPWPEHAEVTAFAARVRSTSVGDVLTLGERTFVVLPVGFRRL